MGFSWLDHMKNYLSDRPEAAILSISLMVNLYLFRLFVRAKDDQLGLVLQWMPVAERMSRIIEAAASKARSRRSLPGSPQHPKGD